MFVRALLFYNVNTQLEPIQQLQNFVKFLCLQTTKFVAFFSIIWQNYSNHCVCFIQPKKELCFQQVPSNMVTWLCVAFVFHYTVASIILFSLCSGWMFFISNFNIVYFDMEYFDIVYQKLVLILPFVLEAVCRQGIKLWMILIMQHCDTCFMLKKKKFGDTVRASTLHSISQYSDFSSLFGQTFTMMKFAVLIVAFFVAGVVGHAGEIHAPVSEEMYSNSEEMYSNIVQAAANTPELSTLVEAVTVAGLADTLSDPELEVTVFAPTNAAFQALLDLLEISFEELANDTETLVGVLQYHVVTLPAMSTDLIDGMMLPTLGTAEIAVDLSDGVSLVGIGSTADVIIPDITAGLSIIHVIDQVLLPY
eukprot:TRINITY_DN383_c0_g3_i2.p1 TRINITY_DN383_c0_g3~~TRINITY_DN383_c0_g3_i2.p1  ORF type:complete len:364 (+),score=40.06 TRINITY_DN383_c0_g3_i2:4628-5719(+)